MINAGILDGDMVLVEQDHTASNGDMVVVLVEDGATVKTFYKERGGIPPAAGERLHGAYHSKRSVHLRKK